EAEHGRRPSEPEAVPEEPLLDGGDEPVGPDPGVGHAIRRRDAEAAAQPAAARLDHLEPHLVAEAVARHRAQIADAVDQAELERLAAGPERAAEQLLLGALEPLAAARAHQRLEALVD